MGLESTKTKEKLLVRGFEPIRQIPLRELMNKSQQIQTHNPV